MNIIIIMVYYCLTKFTKNHTTLAAANDLFLKMKIHLIRMVQ